MSLLRGLTVKHLYLARANFDGLCIFWRIKVGKMPANKHICHASGIYQELLANTGKYWQI